MLSGKSFHSLDAKNRLIIPHNHRLELGLALYATVGYDNNLIIMSKAVYEATAEKIAHSSSEFLEENRELRRDFFGNVAYCEIDKAGRILIPQYLLDLAGISKEVVIIGVYDKLEVWSKEAYEQAQAAYTQERKNVVLKKLAEKEQQA